MQGGNDMDRPAVNKLTYDDFLCFPDDGRRHELDELPGFSLDLERLFAQPPPPAAARG